MSRTERLLDLLQLLRRHRSPLTGAAIAAELGTSLRTVYRDVATLQAQGVHLDGAPGLGYLLRPGAVLPPLAFSIEELEALALGSRWVATQGDAELRAAAVDALAKIAAVVPGPMRHELDTSTLIVGPADAEVVDDTTLSTLRRAIREERKLVIGYRDAAAASSQRTIWPFALGYFDRVRVVVAWCERREAIRHFRSDRIVSLDATACPIPRRRASLLKEWREHEGISAP